MTKVFLGLGSNIDREQHIGNALNLLEQALGDLQLSSVYESESFGFAGDPFYNLVVAADVNIALEELRDVIKHIEDANQRDRSGPKFGPRTLDIDVLTYGELVGEHAGICLPRAEITEVAYVLLPLVELAADELLPGTQQSFQSLWQAFDKSRLTLWRVDFEWRGQAISQAQGA